MYQTIKVFYQKSKDNHIFLYSTNCKKTLVECKMDVEFRLTYYKKDKLVVESRIGEIIDLKKLRFVRK